LADAFGVFSNLGRILGVRCLATFESTSLP
jgi:hypothetical protein